MGRLLADTHPELRTEFLYCVDKHGNRLENKTFNTLTTCSGFSAMWECPKFNCDKKCKHIYRAIIYSRTNSKSGCPICAGQKVCPCNSLAKKYPTVAAEWDICRNGDLKPDQFAPFSHKQVYWLCNKSNCVHLHSWCACISDRTKKQSQCPYCSGTKFCPCNSLAGQYPDLVEEWDVQQNGELTPEDVSPGSTQQIHWICKHSTCGHHKWSTAAFCRTGSKATACPYCNGKKVCACSSLSQKFPHLALEWDYASNGDLKPNQVSVFSGKKIHWICDKAKCNHEHRWVTAVSCRTRPPEGTNCPYCSGKKLCPCTSLAGKYPELVAEWDYERNADLQPEDVAAGSSQPIHWMCRKSSCSHMHRWITTPGHRTTSNSGCPYCWGRNVCPCNSFAARFPSLLEEWDYQKNVDLDPHQIAPFSAKRAYWQCAKCQHSWNTTVCHRSAGQGCPKCRTSKMEKKMHAMLTEFCLDRKLKSFQAQQPLEGTLLKADFLLTLQNDTKIVLEMDGMQHFEPCNFGCTSTDLEDMFLDVVRRDGEKKDWCEKHNIRLLRLSYLVKEEHYAAEVIDFINHVNVCFRLVGDPGK
jgi:hypothetical protein